MNDSKHFNDIVKVVKFINNYSHFKHIYDGLYTPNALFAIRLRYDTLLICKTYI